MPHFTRVETHPPTGFPDRLWGFHPHAPGAPLHDAFLRAARPVVELYSEALDRLDLHGSRASMALSVREQAQTEDDAVRVEVWREQRQMPTETGFVYLNGAVGRLDAAGRARLVLNVVDAAVRTLAPARGWDPAQLDACREHVEVNTFAYRWASPWKSNPDRRHQARASYRVERPDGFGRARLEVRRAADQEIVAQSQEALAFCTSAGLKRSAKTLRWAGADEVGFTPYAGLVSAHHGGRLVARTLMAEWSCELPDPIALRAPGGDGIDEDPHAPVPLVAAHLS